MIVNLDPNCSKCEGTGSYTMLKWNSGNPKDIEFECELCTDILERQDAVADRWMENRMKNGS